MGVGQIWRWLSIFDTSIGDREASSEFRNFFVEVMFVIITSEEQNGNLFTFCPNDVIKSVSNIITGCQTINFQKDFCGAQQLRAIRSRGIITMTGVSGSSRWVEWGS